MPSTINQYKPALPLMLYGAVPSLAHRDRQVHSPGALTSCATLSSPRQRRYHARSEDHVTARVGMVGN